jgi:hypothetical protein
MASPSVHHSTAIVDFTVNTAACAAADDDDDGIKATAAQAIVSHVVANLRCIMMRHDRHRAAKAKHIQ